MLITNETPFFDFGNDITSSSILVMSVQRDDYYQKTYATVRICPNPALEETILLWEGEGYDRQYTPEELETRIREYYDITMNEDILNPTP